MRGLLGVETPAFLRALEQTNDTGLRLNARKTSPESFRERVPWPLAPLPWCPTGFSVDDPERGLGSHPLHLVGAYYLQDPSAMAVAEALSPEPGDWVADLAAAPGGKATRLAERAGREGLLLANDVHPERVIALGQNLERWGADNTILVKSEIDALAEAWGPVFDRVLLDAPCSGEGMFRKSEEAREMWSEATIAMCAVRQRELLAHAARMVAPGGLLVYSTCTFAPEENEAVVADFLRVSPDFSVVPAELPGIHSGRPEWVAGGAPAELAGAGRLWPHHQIGEGHFFACLRRAGPTPGRSDPGSEEDAERRRRKRHVRPGKSNLTGPERDLYRVFREADLAHDPYEDRTRIRVGDQVFALPVDGPTPLSESTVRPGLWLGTLREKRFEPSHALALALEAHDAQRRLDLTVTDPELAAYLTGLEIDSQGADGWVLVCLDGFPLGWGKRVHGVIRNLYPKGLRLR